MNKNVISVGDKVRVKSWDKMKNEFGFSPTGSINCRFGFTKLMRCLEGKEFIITEICGDEVMGLETKHHISLDMLELVSKHKFIDEEFNMRIKIDEKNKTVCILHMTDDLRSYKPCGAEYQGESKDFDLKELIGEVVGTAIGLPKAKIEKENIKGDQPTDEEKARFFEKCTRRDLLSGLMAMEIVEEFKTGKFDEFLRDILK